MDTQKITVKNFGKQATLVVSATAGAMVSDSVVALVPEDKKKWGQIGLALVSTAAAVLVKGTDTTANAIRGAAAGMAIKQTFDLGRETLQSVLPENVKENKYVKPMLGLGCANEHRGEYPPSYNPTMRQRLAMPTSSTISTPSLLG